ncbi:hypothetical protein BU52_21975 [Streptomyces toyocaensis]|uniref:Uncharacterized protein n=2 Tax=Streptomyces toyocaensis TaxID=55952 RepID=A0A081XNH1_STRTO|nr:hypothetical protein [Streptomyces toyocaensis]KES05094.1 hypothetical protein BU52_21975 [Streptomyces toyocaensis]
MLSTVDRTKSLVALPTARRRHSRAATAGPAPAGRPSGAAAEALRIIADPRTPTYVTVYANGRRRYSYWRPLDSTTGTGGCYAALPTADCDELHASGRITLGEPVVDPNRTTYRVRTATRVQPAPVRGGVTQLRSRVA